MTNIETAKQYYVKKSCAGNPTYIDAMIGMRFETFSEQDLQYFKDLYFVTKDIFTRNQILHAFVLQCLQYDLREFFLAAFKKERYLDMRLVAIRGYAAYVTEKEVITLMKKFLEILIKRPSHTPYDYQEYEMLRSKFGLPYLVECYGYNCFKEAMAQLEEQYDEMPDACKGFFTLDENGITVPLLSGEEIDKRLDILFGIK